MPGSYICRLLKNTCCKGRSRTAGCKAPETGDPPEGWEVRVFFGQIPKSVAYMEVRRRWAFLSSLLRL
jgi:hypothetical protein